MVRRMIAIPLILLSQLVSARLLPPLGSACRTLGPKTVDAVCDPDGLLTNVEALQVQQALYKIGNEAPHDSQAGFQTAIALVRSLSGTDIERFAKEAHNKWGVGLAGIDDGLVLAVALEDRELYISTGRGMKHLLSDQGTQIIMERMHEPLREGKTAGALEQAALDILAALQSGLAAEEGKEAERLFPGHDASRASAVLLAASALASREWWMFWGQVTLVLAFVALFAYCVWAAHREAQKRREELAQQARASARLREIQRARAADEAAEAAGGGDGTPLASRMQICPICLDDFPSPTPPGTVTTLPCQHRFHDSCLGSWENAGTSQANRSCPMCRAPIDGGPPPPAAAAPPRAGGGGARAFGGGAAGSSSSSGCSSGFSAAARRDNDLAFLFRRLGYHHPVRVLPPL